MACGHFDFAFSKGRCKMCASKGYKPIKRVSDKRMEKDFSDESWANLRDELDAIFSKYIRLKYANSKGEVECYTCGDVMNWKQSQCGHVGSRADMGSRFYEGGVRVQCPKCNSKHETHPEIFRDKLRKEHPEALEYVDEMAHAINKISVSDLKELLVEYRAKLEIVSLKIKS